MPRSDEEIRVKAAKTLPQAKWLFFAFLTTLILLPSLASRACAAGENITVKAVVPLQAEYGALIEQRSQVTISQNKLYPGEKTVLFLQLIGSGEEVLRRHTLKAVLFHDGLVRKTFSLSSDDFGRAVLEITRDGVWPRVQTLQVYDDTYSEKRLILKEKVTVYALDPLQSTKQDEKYWKKSPGDKGSIFSTGILWVKLFFSAPRAPSFASVERETPSPDTRGSPKSSVLV